ncbi:hypothetical protein HWV62_39896 [Athelia sp. TMB]|nr:hypothetical protein HWV62_39896 [Athelia sp. TMB]
MLKQGCGYPMYYPEPPERDPNSPEDPNCPLTRRKRRGVSVGDVGIIRPVDGAFQYAFNIFAPPPPPSRAGGDNRPALVEPPVSMINLGVRNTGVVIAHIGSASIPSASSPEASGLSNPSVPINQDPLLNFNGVPADFEPMPMDRVEYHLYKHNKNTELTSDGIAKHDLNAAASAGHGALSAMSIRYEASSSSTETTVLTMPEGAHEQRYIALRKIEAWTLQNAQSWYDFMAEGLGFELPQDSFYVVTACEQATAWGIVTASNRDSNQTFSLDFKVDKIGGGANFLCSWSNTTSIGVTPRHSVPSFGDNAPQPHNQSLFISGFKVMIRKGYVVRHFREPVKIKGTDKIKHVKGFLPSKTASLGASSGRGGGTGRPDNSSRPSGGQDEQEAEIDDWADDWSDDSELDPQDGVCVHIFNETQLYSRYCLKGLPPSRYDQQVPFGQCRSNVRRTIELSNDWSVQTEADVAITHERDWWVLSPVCLLTYPVTCKMLSQKTQGPALASEEEILRRIPDHYKPVVTPRMSMRLIYVTRLMAVFATEGAFLSPISTQVLGATNEDNSATQSNTDHPSTAPHAMDDSGWKQKRANEIGQESEDATYLEKVQIIRGPTSGANSFEPDAKSRSRNDNAEDYQTRPTAAQAFTQFDTDISAWHSPHEWHRANRSQLMSTAKLLLENQKRTSNEDLADVNFVDDLRDWKSLDIITAFERHQKISTYLQEIFDHLVPDVHSRHIFEALLALDVVDLSAQLAILLMNVDQHRELLSRRDEPAQALVDLLQASQSLIFLAQRLDYRIESPFKEQHLGALIYLSENSQKYPEALVIKDMALPSEPVAFGSFRDVYKASVGTCYAAVKVLRVHRDLGASAREAVIWRQLSHPNVLPFYGLFCLPHVQQLCPASPWMKNGNLSGFLHEIALETDCVAIPNILVSDARRACLADFGNSFYHDAVSARLGDTDDEFESGFLGALNWVAPELLPDLNNPDSTDYETRRPDKACDVYSFAMACYEASDQITMFSGSFPFKGKRDNQVMNAISMGRRPERPNDSLSQTRGLKDDVWDIIVTSWHQQPEERPTAAQIIQRLHALPGLLPDNRPLDHYDMQLLSRRTLNQNPFAALEGLLKTETKT